MLRDVRGAVLVLVDRQLNTSLSAGMLGDCKATVCIKHRMLGDIA